MKNNRNIIVL